MKKPRLMDYNVKTLIILGNQTQDELSREDIKMALLKKLSGVNYSVLYLLSCFVNSKGILRDVYAELIVMKMYEGEINISEQFAAEVIKLVSMDTLTIYGMESPSCEFREKCKEEFWRRALENEDKLELGKKINVDNPIKIKKLIYGKKKGD